MELVNISSIIKTSLILIFFGLSACGGSSNESSSPPDPATSNKWGEMEWGKGTWGQ